MINGSAFGCNEAIHTHPKSLLVFRGRKTEMALLWLLVLKRNSWLGIISHELMVTRNSVLVIYKWHVSSCGTEYNRSMRINSLPDHKEECPETDPRKQIVRCLLLKIYCWIHFWSFCNFSLNIFTTLFKFIDQTKLLVLISSSLPPWSQVKQGKASVCLCLIINTF